MAYPPVVLFDTKYILEPVPAPPVPYGTMIWYTPEFVPTTSKTMLRASSDVPLVWVNVRLALDMVIVTAPATA